MAFFEIAHVAGQALDFGQIVRGEEDGGLSGKLEKTINQFVAHQWIETGKRLVENNQPRPVGKGAYECCFHAHAARELPKLALERQIKLLDQALCELPVPMRIERPTKIEQCAHRHPVGQLLIF